MRNTPGAKAPQLSEAQRRADAKGAAKLPSVVNGKHWFCSCTQSNSHPSECVYVGCVPLAEVQRLAKGKR